MKKTYISPLAATLTMETNSMIAASQFTTGGGGTQTITPTESEYDGEFTSRRHYDVWG